jgi:CRP/FNR family transcriptional regulator, cyclic AMP receptor protein
VAATRIFWLAPGSLGESMEFLKHTEWPMWFGYAAVASSVITCAMKTMIPLRIVSMTCNALFIVYGFFSGIYPTLILNLILLPLNTLRLQQMRKLIEDVEAAASYGETSIDWLKPFMSRGKFRKGDIVFRKGDQADAMYYSVSGRYRLQEIGIEIPTGQVFGDLGLLAPDNRRTQTIECIEDGEVLTATYQQVKELYFQNPQFGFYFLRLTTERLFDNIGRLEKELAKKNEMLAGLSQNPA